METFFKNLTPEEGTADKLLRDLRTLREDTQELVLATGGVLAEKSRARFLTSVERMKRTCRDIQDQAAAGARVADRSLREHPYTAVGIAFGLGLVIGILARRK
jgi:ElaB/YqjD/DUF883 family membrane-anchored ribosome-binding protein